MYYFVLLSIFILFMSTFTYLDSLSRCLGRLYFMRNSNFSQLWQDPITSCSRRGWWPPMTPHSLTILPTTKRDGRRTHTPSPIVRLARVGSIHEGSDTSTSNLRHAMGVCVASITGGIFGLTHRCG